jgi:hypothetical protein
MKSFNAITLIMINAVLALSKEHNRDKTGFLPEQYRKIMLEIFEDVEEECLIIGLSLSAITAQKIKKTLLQNKVSYDYFNSMIDEFIGRVTDEMASRLFFSIESDKQKLFIGDNLFGDDVAKKFPSVHNDITNAGKCIALDQWTSSVFHSMRILEKGLDSLAKELDVPFDNANWGWVINNIEAKIENVRKNKIESNWKEKEKFYSETALQFRYFKDAWRNYVMHAKDNYDEQQAESIFLHVKEFMIHLATQLTENNGWCGQF